MSSEVHFTSTLQLPGVSSPAQLTMLLYAFGGPYMKASCHEAKETTRKIMQTAQFLMKETFLLTQKWIQ